MTLTISNPDYADTIMEYLRTHYQVNGDEDYLIGEYLQDNNINGEDNHGILTQPDIWAIETALEGIHNEPVTLPKNLRIIQK